MEGACETGETAALEILEDLGLSQGAASPPSAVPKELHLEQPQSDYSASWKISPICSTAAASVKKCRKTEARCQKFCQF
jgi:hypothetical protein